MVNTQSKYNDKARVLGIICSQFPEMHETFVIRELSALKQGGIPIAIYSLKRCRDHVRHPEANAVLPEVRYAAWSDPRVWLSGLAELIRRPGFSFWALSWVLRNHRWPAGDLAKGLVIWIQSLALRRRMAKDGVEHVHAHWATFPTTAALIVSKGLGKPFSFTAHAWDIYVSNRSLVEKLKRAARVITCTEYNRKYLQGLCKENAGKVVLNYHGVDIKKFMPRGLRDKAAGKKNSAVKFSVGEPPEERHLPLLLSIGRLVPTKGYENMLQAYRQLHEKGIEFRSVIVGGGPLRAKLDALISEFKLSGIVRIETGKSQLELRDLCETAYAFVLASEVAENGDRDGIPNVILEAMAMGLPVVTTTISGIPEAVRDQRTGLTVSPRDPEQLAKAIDFLLRNPDFTALLGQRSRETAEAFFDQRIHMGRLVNQMKTLSNKTIPAPSWAADEGGKVKC